MIFKRDPKLASELLWEAHELRHEITLKNGRLGEILYYLHWYVDAKELEHNPLPASSSGGAGGTTGESFYSDPPKEEP